MKTPNFEFLWTMAEMQEEYTVKLYDLCKKCNEDFSFAMRATGHAFVNVADDIREGRYEKI